MNCLLVQVAPYFPASNVLFYVGTFIGERLLYFPSVGYCILLAGLLTHAPGAAARRLQPPVQKDNSGMHHIVSWLSFECMLVS